MMYNVQKDLMPDETIELFESFRLTRFSDSEDFQSNEALSGSRQRSITYAGTKTWNELTRNIKKLSHWIYSKTN